MGNDHPDRKKRVGSTPVPPEAVFDQPRRLEPLGEGYDERDRRLDDALTAQARTMVQQTTIPPGLNDRLMQGVEDALDAGRAPLPLDVTSRSHATHGLQRLALAACLGFAVVISWWFIDGSDSRSDRTPAPLVATVVNPEPAPPADIMSVQADLAMLASSGTHEELDQLAILIATRDMSFSDATGDLAAVLDAMQNPSMQAYDVEVWR
jgi:hypothetical protein